MANYTYDEVLHPLTGWRLARLTCAEMGEQPASQFALCPEQGCNLLSFRVSGQDYIVDLGDGPDGPRLLGTPILYPMPNRVRDGRFTFAGRTFTFPPNNGPNFIHGLVRDRAWSLDAPSMARDHAALTARYRLAPGEPAYARFPIRNSLEVTFTLRPGTLRLDFCVRNEDEAQDLPFGLAIHPYFPIIGERRQVRLEVPARAHMEAVDLLPTGCLEPLDGSPYDLRSARSLEGLHIDDVYWGLRPEAPQVIYYDAIGKRLTLAASALFTHSVVYTPEGQPFFCVENQSCSTDAHNLYARGLQEAAHLTVLPPGGECRAWVEMRVTDQ